MKSNSNGTVAGKLLLTPREAAAALGICEKSLWSMTVPRGSLPSVKLGAKGGSVRYSVTTLEQWISEQQGQDAGEEQ